MKNQSIWMQTNPLASLVSSLIEFTFLIAIAFLCGISTNASANDPFVAGSETQTLTYEKDVLPILKAMCFHCHGEEPVLAGGFDTRLVRLMVKVVSSAMLGYVHGKTDDFSHHAVEGIVQHHEWLATVLHQFGLDHAKLRHKSGGGELSLVQAAATRVAKELLA